MKWNCSSWLLLVIMAFNLSRVQAENTVNIVVNGRVIATPCTISTPVANVDLGTLDMTPQGSIVVASVWHNIELYLTNCPSGTSSIMATFKGDPDTESPLYYQNNGSAGNIRVELQDDKGEIMNNGAQKIVSIDDSTRSAIVHLKVRAMSRGKYSNPGSIQVAISVTYTWL